MTQRKRLLDEVAALVPPEARRVAVDGVDGVGKSTFAGELAGALRAGGRPVVQVSGSGCTSPPAAPGSGPTS